MKKYIVLPALLLVLLGSCSEQEIGLYEEQNYIYFEKNVKDTTLFSFFFHLSDVVEFPVVVNVAGKLPTEDLEYKVTIDEKLSNAPSKLYEMPDRFVFRKGMAKDTFYIKFTNDANDTQLKVTPYLLAFQIDGGDNLLMPGEVVGRMTMKVSDKAEKPEWWTVFQAVPGGPVNTKSVESIYLGKYSDYKYECFMKVTGVSDMTGYSGVLMREKSIIFKRWLAVQNPKILDEANHEEMTVPVVGE